MQSKKRSFKKIILLSLLGLVVCLVIINVSGVFRSNSLQVEVEEIAPKDLTELVTASGKIQPEQEVLISPDVSGEIIELKAIIGQKVKKGDLLVKIQPDIYQAAVSQSQAALNTSKAQLRATEASYKQTETRSANAKVVLDRNKTLMEQGIISKANYEAFEMEYLVSDQSKAAAFEQLQSSRYQVQSAASSLKEAQDRLNRTVIYAPMNGTVTSLSVEKGERVVGTNQMAGTEIMKIADLRVMEVLVEVSEIDITRISPSDETEIEIDAFQNRKFKGIVTEIAKSAKNSGSQTFSEQSSTFEVKTRILAESYQDLIKDTSQTPFMPGMSAMIDIITEKKKQVIAIPILAVTTKEIEDTEDVEKNKLQEIVFLSEDGKAKEVNITTGIQDDFHIEVTEGLEEGQEIIVGPYDAITIYLTDGKAIENKSKTNRSE